MRPVESARLRIASKHSDKIRKALVAGINTKKLAEDFLATHKGASITPQQARDWVKVNAVADNKDLTNALRYAYADAWVIGHKSGLSQLGYAYGINKATPSMGDFIQSMSVDWSKWTPGNEAAAALLSPPNGLQTLLNASHTVIQSIDQTSYDRLGTQLASALSQGLTMDDTASLISDVLDDPSRALTIAVTESARATTAASRAVYEDSGVEYVTWLVAEGCDDCQENADAGPIPIDATFPTGDAEPPAHPNCMCDLSPYVVDTQGIGGDALDNSFTPSDGEDSGDSGAAVDNSSDLALQSLDGVDSLKLQQFQQEINPGFVCEGIAGSTMTEEQSGALAYYRGMSYQKVNGFLRGTLTGSDTDPEMTAYYQKTVDNIDSVIAQAPPLENDSLVFRGYSGTYANKLAVLEEGDSYTEANYASTSLLKSVANKDFAKDEGVTVEIVAPVGTQGVMMRGFFGGDRYNEHEFLLPRNSTFEVISKAVEKNGKTTMRVRVVK